MSSAPPNPSAALPREVIIARPRGSRFAFWLGWAGFLFCALALIGLRSRFADYFDQTGGITEKFVSGGKFADEKVAVITVDGVIMGGDGFVKKQIEKIREDKDVKAIVLRIDSPGGTVTGSDYLYHHLKKLRDERKLPVVVSMGSMAASGGYYLAMAVGDTERSIFAEPTTMTGSIGVMIPRYDVSELLEKIHVKDDAIASHERKLMLSMTRPLVGEQRELIQGTVNDMFERFKAIVKEGRPVYRKDPSALDQLATGEVFLADKAKLHGLVDEIGFVEDAIDRALELAHLTKSQTRVVKYHQDGSLLEALGVPAAKLTAPSSPLEGLFDLATPRAFYLYSAFPAAMSAR